MQQLNTIKSEYLKEKHKYYLITDKFLENLLEHSLKYTALEMGGVDNWEGYSLSFEEFLSSNGVASFEELIEQAKEFLHTTDLSAHDLVEGGTADGVTIHCK